MSDYSKCLELLTGHNPASDEAFARSTTAACVACGADDVETYVVSIDAVVFERLCWDDFTRTNYGDRTPGTGLPEGAAGEVADSLALSGGDGLELLLQRLHTLGERIDGLEQLLVELGLVSHDDLCSSVAPASLIDPAARTSVAPEVTPEGTAAARHQPFVSEPSSCSQDGA